MLIGHWKKAPHEPSRPATADDRPAGTIPQAFLSNKGLPFVYVLFIILPMDDRTATLAPVIAGPPLPAGQTLARGVARHLLGHDFVSVQELVPARGVRVDLMALGPRGEIWVIECKSSRSDFVTDKKWHFYLEWCDRFFWAVDADFPTDLLPEGTGLIVADGYDAEILRMGPEARLAGARRKMLLQLFARHAARRLQGFRDPGATFSSGFSA